eukprot:12929020-Prorocentrum_lima.AAC.1
MQRPRPSGEGSVFARGLSKCYGFVGGITPPANHVLARSDTCPWRQFTYSHDSEDTVNNLTLETGSA